MNEEEWIAALAATIALGTFVFGVLEYVKAQRWKKAEFIAQEVKNFFNDPNLKRAFKMLDWNYTQIPTQEGELGKNERGYFEFSDSIFIRALRYHREDGHFTSEEELIRDLMDDLFFKFCLFQKYIESKLVKPRDLKPYLNYYIRLIADPKSDRHSEEWRASIHNYLRKYHFYDLLKLCENMGYPIPKEPVAVPTPIL